MALEKQIITLPLTGGLDSKTGPLAVSPGSFLQLDDVRQERRHEWRNRQGITHADSLDDLSSPPFRSVELPGGGLVALDAGGSNQVAALSYTRNVPATAARWIRHGTGTSHIRPTHWKRRPIATEIYPVYLNTVAVGNSLRLVAWKPGNVTVGQEPVRATIVSDTDGTTVAPIVNLGPSTATSPVAVFAAAANVFLLFYASGANLKVAKWDGATGAFVSDTTLKTNVAATTQLIDALYYTGTNVTVAYRNAAGNVHQLEVNPTTLALATDVDLGVSCEFALQLGPEPDASGTRLIGTCTSVPAVRVLRTTSAGVVSSNDLVESVAVTNMALMAYQSGAGWMIVYDNSSNNAMFAAKKRSGVVGAVTQLTPIYSIGTAVKLDSNAWREPGSDAMRYMVGIHIGAFATTGDYQHSYFEMAMEYENGSSGINNRYTEPQARILPLNAGLPIVGFNCLPQVVRRGSNLFTVPLKRLATPQIAAGLTAHRFAIETWDQTIMSALSFTGFGYPNLGPGVIGPQASYLPAGLLLQSVNGSSLVGHGAGAIPFKPTVALASNASGLNVDQSYQYVITDERQDEAGYVWHSPPSIASDPITPTAGNRQVNVTVRLSSLENLARLRTIKIWRTLGNGAVIDDNGEYVVQLVDQRTILCDPTGSVFTFQDTVPDTSLDDSNFIQPGLQATITPAFNHVAFFDGRMWGAERDFGNRLRYSKTMQRGTSPEFPAEFFKDIEDEDGEITLVAALDDKLIVGKESAIYFIAAGGPGDDGSGSQYTIVKVSSEYGGQVGAPYQSTGSHVWFTDDGPKRIDRSLHIDDIGIPVDRFFSMPLLQSQEMPLSVTYNHLRSEFRLLTVSYRFVYDLANECWIRDTGGPAGTLYMQKLRGVGDMFFRSNGQVWWDYDVESPTSTADASGTIRGFIRSPWFRLAQAEGFMRLYAQRALWKRDPETTTTSWPTTTTYFNDEDSTAASDTPTGTSGAAKQTTEQRAARMRCTSFALALQFPSGDLKWRLSQWSVLMAIKKSMYAQHGARAA